MTDDDAGIGDSAMRVRWNKAVCDKLLLPLLPTALANAVQGISEGAARSLLKAVTGSRIVQSHLLNVTRQHLLLPEVTENGIRWKAFSPEGLNVLSIPGWSEAPIGFHKHFLTRLEDRASDTVFIDRDGPRLGGAVGAWPLEWIEFLLDCISAEMFRASQELLWIETLLLHLLGSPSRVADSRAVAVASWLASRIGEGALGTTAEGAATEVQTELRSNWLRVFAALPKAWLVSAPLATQRAVAELAKDGVIGAGLLPVPLERNPDIDRSSCPDAQRVDGALLKLGKRLLEDSKAPQLMRRSRLLLAEALLSVRGTESLGGELSQLPLLRALRLPEDRDEAWCTAPSFWARTSPHGRW